MSTRPPSGPAALAISRTTCSGLHTSDPQFLPESNLRFALSAPLIASVYLGDALSFALYAMASQPELYARIQQEADALFDDGDPAREDFTESTIDVTRRFIMESMRCTRSSRCRCGT